MAKYTAEQKEKAIELYKNGLSSYKIADLLGISKSTIQKWAYDSGIRKKEDASVVEERKSKIKELYLNGMSCNQIAEILNLPRSTVIKYVNSMDISRGRGMKSLIEREDYFDAIDCEEKAYWLGYLMADGNVSTHNNQYSLKLHVGYEDKELIDKFLECIGSPNKPVHKEETNSYYVSISSKHMIHKLIEYGVTPRKSGREKLPDIPDDLIRHFIRGYFDGDGITCIKKNKRSGFVGGKDIIEAIHRISSCTGKIYDNGTVHYFLGGIKYSKSLYKYMYTDATIWLKRKRERMDIICGNTEIT